MRLERRRSGVEEELGGEEEDWSGKEEDLSGKVGEEWRTWPSCIRFN